jgi:hypothetical protein
MTISNSESFLMLYAALWIFRLKRKKLIGTDRGNAKLPKEYCMFQIYSQNYEKLIYRRNKTGK